MSRFTLDIKKKRLNEGGETLEQAAQLSCGCTFVLTLPVNICISSVRELLLELLEKETSVV